MDGWTDERMDSPLIHHSGYLPDPVKQDREFLFLCWCYEFYLSTSVIDMKFFQNIILVEISKVLYNFFLPFSTA